MAIIINKDRKSTNTLHDNKINYCGLSDQDKNMTICDYITYILRCCL